MLATAAALSEKFPFWLSDVWGVIHDGARIHAKAEQALIAHRRAGGRVVLISNAPRPAFSVEAQLLAMGLSRDAFDGIVTSGDVTLRLAAARAGEAYFLIGPAQKDADLLSRVPNARADVAEEAQFLLCTGPDDDERETAEDYAARLAHWAGLGLPMICANPDRVVQRGGRLITCAGALADAYEALGGKVEMAGKPFAHIYRDGLRVLGCASRAQVLAIGDGMVTDAEGAFREGLALAFITGGIHAADFPDAEAAAAELQGKFPGLQLAGVLAELA